MKNNFRNKYSLLTILFCITVAVCYSYLVNHFASMRIYWTVLYIAITVLIMRIGSKFGNGK